MSTGAGFSDHERLWSTLVATLLAVLFILLGAALIPYAGLGDDELFFVTPLYPAWQHVTMVATYIGSVKTQIYWPVFKIFGPNAWSVRLPMVVAGALTMWILYYLTRRSAGGFAALLAAALLATDPTFILTNTFDRGPVVLEQLLLMAGCWFLVRYGTAADSGDRRGHYCKHALALAFFCFGLATWSKAVFGWLLIGLAAGGLAVFRQEIRRALRPAMVATAAAAFLLGALPLVIYNVRHFNSTLRLSAHLENWQGLKEKWISLKNNANGSLFEEDFVSAENSASPKPAFSLRGRAAVWIREHLGEHHQTGFGYVFCALLAAVPWWRRSRAARFSLAFLAGAWIAMAATSGGGAYSAHVALMWPFPMLFAASALAALPWRRLAIVTGAGMIAMNLLVLSQYIAQYERNGPDEIFSDAIYPLSAALVERPGQAIYYVDWNVANALTLLHEGRLDLRKGNDPLLSESPSESEIGQIRAMVSDRDALFVAHVSEFRGLGELRVHLERTAESLGYHRETLRTIADSNGRAVFGIFRFRPVGGAIAR